MSRDAFFRLVLALGVLLADGALAGELSAGLGLAPEWHRANSGSPYAIPAESGAPATRAIRQDLSLRYVGAGIHAEGRLRVFAADGQAPDRQGIVNQLFYEAPSRGGHGILAGKKVMSWGVGFGLRPLDVVQREDRRALNPAPLIGVPLLAWEYLDGSDAMTLAWTNPGRPDADNDMRDQALAARYYRLAGDVDLHAVARASSRHGLETGAGLAFPASDEWVHHAALLYQRRRITTLNELAENGVAVLSSSDPMHERRQRHGFKAVTGSQWTGGSGVSVLTEAWYDGEACSRSEWQRLNQLTARQRALTGLAPLPAINGNVAWSSRAFASPNLLRENVLLRLAYEADAWKPALEVLLTPRDGGRVWTASLAHEGNRQRTRVGLRQLGGPAGSAYAQSPVRQMVYAEWRLSFL